MESNEHDIVIGEQSFVILDTALRKQDHVWWYALKLSDIQTNIRSSNSKISIEHYKQMRHK